MIKIEQVNEEEFTIIEKLGKESLPIYYCCDDLKMLKMTGHFILKISKERNIVGFVVCRETKDNIHILSIAVKNNDRKMGYGSKLIDFLKQKNKNLSLYVHTINEIALNFYKKNKFIISDILFGYYESFENDKDAYKMKFEL